MIVPGSLAGTDHPTSWYARVKNKKTGKETTLWINGNHLNQEAVAQHLAVYFTNAEPITIERCLVPPGMLKPVPPDLFEYGIRAKIEENIREPSIARPIPLQPIKLQPL